MDEPALSLTPLGMEEIVVLKLKGVAFKVNKTKLSNESLYFNKLFTGNYRDSGKKEFDIEYKVNLETFKVSYLLLYILLFDKHNCEQNTMVLNLISCRSIEWLK